MPFRPARRAAVFLVASLTLTALIAAGLSRMRFQPGLPLPSFAHGEVSLSTPDQAPVGMPMGRFAGIIILIVIGVAFLALIVRALWGVDGKRLLSGFWSLLWKLALGAAIVMAITSLLPGSVARAPQAPPPPPARPLATAPLGPVPPFLLWAAAVGVAAVVLVLAARLVLSRRPDDRSWEREVVLARQALLDGGELRGVIIRCYARMAEVLKEERGIEREASMTTGEFEAMLEAKGLPREPVQALTRLFEAARYSPWEPAEGEERGAIRCLETILDSAGRLPGDQPP